MKTSKIIIKKLKNGTIKATSTTVDLRQHLKALGYVMKPDEEAKQPDNA